MGIFCEQVSVVWTVSVLSVEHTSSKQNADSRSNKPLNTDTSNSYFIEYLFSRLDRV